jgi:hypothetical protein
LIFKRGLKIDTRNSISRFNHNILAILANKTHQWLTLRNDILYKVLLKKSKQIFSVRIRYFLTENVSFISIISSYHSHNKSLVCLIRKNSQYFAYGTSRVILRGHLGVGI